MNTDPRARSLAIMPVSELEETSWAPERETGRGYSDASGLLALAALALFLTAAALVLP